MVTVATLDQLAAGDLGPRAAWNVVKPLLVDAPNDHQIARVYFALRSWTWKAIDRRRRDEKLRQWIDVMNRTESFIADRFGSVATKIEALVELLYESLAVADTTRSADPLRRKHAREIALLLRARDDEWTPRAELIDHIGLKPANLTRLMNILADARLIEVEERGREIAYRLSVDGVAAIGRPHRPAATSIATGVLRSLNCLRFADWTSGDRSFAIKAAAGTPDHFPPSLYVDTTALIADGAHHRHEDWLLAVAPAAKVSLASRPSDTRTLVASVGGDTWR